MGQFPYECAKCGGGYERCAFCTENKCHRCDDLDNDPEACKNGHEECEGGQFCWEDDVMIIIDKNQPYVKNPPSENQRFSSEQASEEVLHGSYGGYGIIKVENYPQFDFFSMDSDLSVEDLYKPHESKNKVIIISQIFCKSCYDNKS